MFMLLIALLAGACQPTPTATPPTPTLTSRPPTLTPLSTTALRPTLTSTFTQTPTPAGELFYLTALDMVSLSVGWALTPTTVLRTTDGGATWVDVTPEDWDDSMVPTSGFFHNAEQAWLAQTDPVDFERGMLYSTGDGGASWEAVEVPFGAGMMSFIDNQNGWLMAGLGAGAGSQAIAIFATHDGGATWSEVYRRDTSEPEPPGEIPLSGMKQGITFRDLQHGWVTGSVPADDFVYLYATEDGGLSFQQRDIPLPPGMTTAMFSLAAPVFYNATQGVLPVNLFTPELSATVLYTTVDGGETWNPTTLVPVIGRFSMPTATDFMVWDGNIFYRSADGGQTWQEITPDVNLDGMVSTLDFVDAENGWVTWMDGDGNAGLMHTSDGGATWVELVP